MPTDDKSKRKKQNYSQPLYMYVVRVLLGNAFVSDIPYPFLRVPCTEPSCGDKDRCFNNSHSLFNSVIGTHRPQNKGGGRLLYREFVVYNADQCYPEYFVEYVRVA